LRIDLKLLIILSLTFILMTVIGTLSHELGHYSVSRFLGYEASINYQSSGYWNTELLQYLDEVNKNYSNEIKNNLDFPDKERYQITINKFHKDAVWIFAAGPLQTILTGTIGLILLLVYRNKLIKENYVTILGWILIFASLFWLRQVANLFMGLLMLVIRGQVIPRGDEMILAINRTSINFVFYFIIIILAELNNNKPLNLHYELPEITLFF